MKKSLKITGISLVLLLTGLTASFLYLQYALPDVDAAPQIDIAKTPALVKRGEYLAHHVAACMDCHSTRDWTLFSGPAIAGTLGKGGEKFDHTLGFPGTFYARNIAPDKETGIGSWTDGEIYRAITAGVSRSGEPLFPVMPYKAYSQMSQQDAYAIIAYLRTLNPVKNKVPASKTDFPMNLILRTIPSPAGNTAEPILNNEIDKGKYLLTIAACADCHTPQYKGSPVEEKKLAGGLEFKMPNGAVIRSANLTPDKETGLGNWPEEAFVNRFKGHATSSGTTPKLSADHFNSVMPWSMYAGMEEKDLRAIYRYLMSLEPIKNKVVKFTPASKP